MCPAETTLPRVRCEHRLAIRGIHGPSSPPRGAGLEPIRKLRGVLRRGILVVAKAARSAHPRGGLQRPSQRRPPAKDPPPGEFSRKRSAGFVARRSQIPAGMLPLRSCIPPKPQFEGGPPADRFRAKRQRGQICTIDNCFSSDRWKAAFFESCGSCFQKRRIPCAAAP